MRIHLTLNRGIATLALSASMFLGCQNFLSEDKAVQSAKTSSGDNVQPALHEASPQDKAGTETATDLPLITADTSKPAAPTTPSTPPATDNVAECKKILTEMQTAKDPLYGELKNKAGDLKCLDLLMPIAGPTVPPTPPDSATLCKNLKSTLAMLDPSSPKYPSYQQDVATYCADPNTPAAPVAPPSTPAAQDNEAECKEIYAAMQNAKEPLYGELKNQFGNLNCDLSKAAGPYVPTPPDLATICKNLKSTLAILDPSSPKYLSYQQEIATHCTP